METITIAESGEHRNLLLDDSPVGAAVQSNQHLVIHGREALLLDPGGPKTFRRAYPETLRLLGQGDLRYVFFSHQDPDVLAAANGWLVSTEAEAYISELWLRFVPHFGLDKVTAESVQAIPDEGTVLPLEDAQLWVIPAHFLHSAGNFQLYDPVTRVLYTGDLGASLGQKYREVEDFDAHLPYMRPFHQRYMAGSQALQTWVALARQLDIEVIAPQHGALFRGPELVGRFLDWCQELRCGVDLLEPYRLPPGVRREG